MKDINTYIVTCDKTKHILKVTIPLMEKYWNVEKSIKILGYNSDGIGEIPKEYEFISMKPQQENIDNWATDIYSTIRNDPNEHIIFMLDDMLQLDYINSEIFNVLLQTCRDDKNIVRCALCIDLQFLPCHIIKSINDYFLIEQNQDSQYRITTQPSIWRKDYLLSILSKSTNPWQFETAHPANDGKRIIGTMEKFACMCMGETALSSRYPGKFNVLGLKITDINWLVDMGVLDKNNLQFGQYLGTVPQFSQYGYNFKLEVLNNYYGNDGKSPYGYYLKKYGSNYK
jgi:hypothetical protein